MARDVNEGPDPMPGRPCELSSEVDAVVARAEAVPVLEPLSQPAVRAALGGDAGAIRALVEALTPIIHARVSRVLTRRRASARADARTTQEDLVQDVFVELLRDGGKVLRTWNPVRGMQLAGFVGLVAEQRVAATLRSRRRNPWSEELAIDDGDVVAEQADHRDPEARVLSRAELEWLLDEVRARLSPMGLELFYALVVREEAIPSVCARTGLSTAAVQAWSSRLKRLVQALAVEQRAEAAAGDEPEGRPA